MPLPFSTPTAQVISVSADQCGNSFFDESGSSASVALARSCVLPSTPSCRLPSFACISLWRCVRFPDDHCPERQGQALVPARVEVASLGHRPTASKVLKLAGEPHSYQPLFIPLGAFFLFLSPLLLCASSCHSSVEAVMNYDGQQRYQHCRGRRYQAL